MNFVLRFSISNVDFKQHQQFAIILSMCPKPYSHIPLRTKISGIRDYIPFGNRANLDSNMGYRALAGAGVGGLLGSAVGGLGGATKALLFDEDESNSNIIKNVLRGAGIGGLSGLGAGALLGTTNKAFDMEWDAREGLAKLYNNILRSSANQADRVVDSAVKKIEDAKIDFSLLKGEAKLKLPESQGSDRAKAVSLVEPYLLDVKRPEPSPLYSDSTFKLDPDVMAAEMFAGRGEKAVPEHLRTILLNKYLQNIEILPETLPPDLARLMK